MDERVAKLIEEGKASYKKRRDDHLISLGLIDENKTERKYKDRYSSTTKFDEEKNQFYEEVPAAISVTEEEYAEICKYYPPKPKKQILEKTGAERALSVIATITLIAGIICTLICLFTDLVFTATGFITILGVLFSSLITWALLRVISDISYNIRRTNYELRIRKE
jgi:hypothetical protein